MTAASLTEWRERLGLNKTEASALLGLSPNAYGAYERGRRYGDGAARKIPRYVALACAAIAAGLAPHP